MDLRTNREFALIDSCDRGGECLLRDTSRVYNTDTFRI